MLKKKKTLVPTKKRESAQRATTVDYSITSKHPCQIEREFCVGEKLAALLFKLGLAVYVDEGFENGLW